MKYPKVFSESDTLKIAAERSIARFGDGELRIILGGQAPSQTYDFNLACELRSILKESASLACIPTPVGHSPAEWFWKSYMDDKFVRLYEQHQYGSSWVTRADNAPWIDTDEHWNGVIDLWRNKDVVLVTGDEKSLTPHFMHDAKSIRFVHGPRTNAYAQIGRLMEEVGKPSEPVLMCLGATATVMAERLALKGVHALDLGHVGMFMKRWNKRLTIDDLSTPEYRALIKDQKNSAGAQYVVEASHWYDELGCKSSTVFTLRSAFPSVPADFIICNILHRVERDRLKNVLWYLKTLMKVGGYFVISEKPSKDKLPDGRNANILVEPDTWWIKQITRMGLRIAKTRRTNGILELWLHNVEP